MITIALDATNWLTPLDFYDALLERLGAPEWHGRSADALIDSMIHGDINAIDPPFVIVVRGLNAANVEARLAVAEAFDALAGAGASLRTDETSATLEIAP